MLSPDIVTLGVKISMHEFGEDTIQSTIGLRILLPAQKSGDPVPDYLALNLSAI